MYYDNVRRLGDQEMLNLRVRIRCRNTLLIFTIRCGDGLWQLIVWKRENVVQEIQVRLVLVISLRGLIQVWHQESESTSAIVSGGCEIRQRHGILHIHYKS